jgi:hypothetical protein
LGERRLCKPEVVGSIPIFSTTVEGKRRDARASPANASEFQRVDEIVARDRTVEQRSTPVGIFDS